MRPIQIMVSGYKAVTQLIKDWRELDMRFKSLSFIGAISLVGLVAYGCMTTVQEDFVATIEVHVEAIAEDYKYLLEHEDTPAFVAFQKIDGMPGYKRVEFISGKDREKATKSRYRSVLELQRVLSEAKAKK